MMENRGVVARHRWQSRVPAAQRAYRGPQNGEQVALIKSLAVGAVASLVIANLAHEDGALESSTLGIVEMTVRDQRIAWSWTVFARSMTRRTRAVR